MVVKCVDNRYANHLTLGKNYKVLSQSIGTVGEKYYIILNDIGVKNNRRADRFIINIKKNIPKELK